MLRGNIRYDYIGLYNKHNKKYSTNQVVTGEKIEFKKSLQTPRLTRTTP